MTTINKYPYVAAAIIAVILTAISYGVALAAHWVTGTPNLLEVFAVFTSYGSTYLCVVQKRFNYILGFISSAAYALLFWQYGLIASAILNAYLVFTLAYGWFRWRSDTNPRPVEHVKLKNLFLIYTPVTLAAFGVAYLIVTALGGHLAPFDSLILVGTILAQFLLDNKKLENWIVWAIVNVAAIWVYSTTGLPLAALQYVFFLGNTVYGFMMWKKSMK